MPAERVISVINSVLILLFGVCLSVEIAGGCEDRRQKQAAAGLCALLLAVQGALWALVGMETVEKLYPLITHLPLMLGLIFLLKKPFGVSVVSVYTAYLCCEIPNWARMLIAAASGSALAGEISYLLLLLPVYLLLRRYFVRAAHEAMTCSPAALALFGSLPVAFYFFDYAVTIYSDALYTGARAVNESLPALLVVFYVLFLTAYHVQLQRRTRAELQSSMLEAKWSQAQTEMETLRRSQAQTSVYQHDMRHHLNAIDAFLASGQPEQAREYIHRVQSEVEALSVRRYCENELVNLLCSSFAERARRRGIRLTVSVRLPAELGLPDTELCSMLSNGLENAFRAVEALDEARRTVELYCSVRLNKLLLEIKNPYDGELVMCDGLPVSDRAGHGYGCRSMQEIASRRGGLFELSAEGGVFVLRLALPLARGKAEV